MSESPSPRLAALIPCPTPPAPLAVAYLKGLVTAGEVASAARQAPDRQLARILCEALQQRVDAAAGDTALPVETALQLVANIASLLHSLAGLEEFALAQARGDTAETVAAAAEAAAAAAASRSPSPGRQRSRSQSPTKAGGGAGSEGLQARGRQPLGGDEPAAAGGGSRQDRSRSHSRASSAASAPSPPRSPLPAAAALAAASSSQQPQQSGSSFSQQQQQGHTTLSVSASGAAGPVSHASTSGRPSSGGSGSGAALQALLESAEALVVRSMSARCGGWLAEGEALDWAPAEQASSIGGLSPHIEELVLYLKVGAGLGWGACCGLLASLVAEHVTRSM